MTKISAVLPLKTSGRHYADNIARCDILFSSLRHFTTPETFDKILIVVPHDEFEAAKGYAKAWSDFPVEVIDESIHMTTFAEFNQRHQIRPWHRQQIIKLYTPALISTEFFIVFDPDVFAMHPFTAETLIQGGRALTHYQPRSAEPHVWQESGKLLQLDLDMSKAGIWWTPAILSRTICQHLHRRLEELYGTEWTRVLLANYTTDWTEYTLYWLNAEREGLIDRFHLPAELCHPALHASSSVWYAGKDGSNLDLWDAEGHFNKSDALFAVIQSNTRILPEKVVARLRPFFPITLQHYERNESLSLKIAEFYSAVTRRALRLLRRIFGAN